VLPRALTRAAHHEQIAPAEIEGARGASARRPEEEAARGSERDDGHDRVVAFAADAVAVEGDAVAAVAVARE
jgi:hypothetical protein